MTDVRIGRLQSLGLTENQAKAYTALLELGRSTASALNKLSGVPRNKVYAVMEELNEKGLVDIYLEDPIVFAPRPIAHYLDLLANDLESRRRELVDSVDDLRKEFKITATLAEEQLQGGTFRIYKGRRAILQQHARMNREAEKSVRVLATRASAARTFQANSISEFADRDKLEFEVLTPLTEDNKAEVRQLAEIFGEAVRVTPGEGENVVIKVVDDHQVMFTHLIPDSTSTTTGDDVGVWTDNPVFLRLALDLVARARDRSHSVSTATRVLEEGLVSPEVRVVQDADERRTVLAEAFATARTVDIVAPSDDIMNGIEALVDPERLEALRHDGVKIRILTDVSDDLIALAPADVDIEIRHVNAPPAIFVLFEDRVLRGYQFDLEESPTFQPGRAVVYSTLPAAVKEARDHFDRIWEDATTIELPDARPEWLPHHKGMRAHTARDNRSSKVVARMQEQE